MATDDGEPPPALVAGKGPAPTGVPGWLDWVEPGFAAMFATAFEEIGVEDTGDFGDMDEEATGERESLLRNAGATDEQVRKITTGMATAASAVAVEPAAIATTPAPAPTATAATTATATITNTTQHTSRSASPSSRGGRGRVE